MIPPSTPSERTSKGWRNPRKSSSSANGATGFQKPRASPQNVRGFSSSRHGASTSGMRSRPPERREPERQENADRPATQPRNHAKASSPAIARTERRIEPARCPPGQQNQQRIGDGLARQSAPPSPAGPARRVRMQHALTMRQAGNRHAHEHQPHGSCPKRPRGGDRLWAFPVAELRRALLLNAVLPNAILPDARSETGLMRPCRRARSPSSATPRR